MNKETETDSMSFIDNVFGGDAMRDETHHDDHSQTTENDEESTGDETDDEFSIPDDESDSVGDEDGSGNDDGANGDNFAETEDNAPAAEKASEKDSAELKQELENLQKRLHDTQAAMHKATTERAALKKELDDLKAKKENEDDWFSEDDSEREKELENSLKKADEDSARLQAEQDDLKKEEAAKVWDEAAAPVIKQHPDFEKVMYEQFAPLLDSQKGDQYVIAERVKLKDKSPASAYAFAKKMLEVKEFQRDPEAYRAKLLKSNKQNNDFENDVDDEPRGKDGLDMLNSADVASAPSERIGSFVDAVFG